MGHLRERAERGVDGYLDQVLIDRPGRQSMRIRSGPVSRSQIHSASNPQGVSPRSTAHCFGASEGSLRTPDGFAGLDIELGRWVGRLYAADMKGHSPNRGR